MESEKIEEIKNKFDIHHQFFFETLAQPQKFFTTYDDLRVRKNLFPKEIFGERSEKNSANEVIYCKDA